MGMEMERRLYKLALWYIEKCNLKWNVPKKEIKTLDRLTYKNFGKYMLFYGADAEWKKFSRYDVLDNAIQKLASYEDAEEQGLLKMFPCKVGDVVYFPKYDYHDSAVITQIEIDKEGITFYWAQYEVGVDCTELWDDGCFTIDEIGKTVFLTREEAEKALKQMKGE